MFESITYSNDYTEYKTPESEICVFWLGMYAYDQNTIFVLERDQERKNSLLIR